MIDRPENIWQKKYANVFKNNTKSQTHVILDVVNLIIHNENNYDLSRLYDRVGLETFIKVIELFDGRAVRFPKKDDFRNTLLLALCYYYHEIEKKNWDEVKELVPFDINPVSMGIRIGHLNRQLRSKVDTLLHDIEDE